ncbi:DNA mismatch repair protein MutS [Cucumispora dikerogammari]|nr:DNA mismatch repair protein MutS [Cucumispora dikerogammari]
MIASLVFTRGKYKLITTAILNPRTNVAIIYTFYDTHLFTLTDELFLRFKIKLVYLWKDLSFFHSDTSIILKPINRDSQYKLINNNNHSEKEQDVYKSECLWLLNEYKFSYITKPLINRLLLSENIEPKTIKDIYKLYFNNTLLIDDVILRYPLSDKTLLEKRLTKIRFFKKHDLIEKLKILKNLDFRNTRDCEAILMKIVGFIETVKYINELGISTGDAEDNKNNNEEQLEIKDLLNLELVETPVFIDLNYPHIKLDYIPLWKELETLLNEINNEIQVEANTFKAIPNKFFLKVNKNVFDLETKSTFFQNEETTTTLNYEEFLQKVHIIKENKNSIIFTTQKVKELQLKKQMIFTQKREIVAGFLANNLTFKNSNDFNYKTLKKLEEIRNIWQIAKMSESIKDEEFFENLKFSKNLLVKSGNPVFSHPELNIHILTGNNMSGKSTYLKYILMIVLLSQVGVLFPFKVTMPVFECIFLIKQEPLKTKTNVSSLESELLCIFNVLEYFKQNTGEINLNKRAIKLILVDEFGKSGNSKESSALSSLFLKRLSKYEDFHCFFITHDFNLVNFCRKQISKVNFLKTEYFKVSSGISSAESIANLYLNISVNLDENRPREENENEKQFALVLKEGI